MLFDSHVHLQDYLEPDRAGRYLRELYDNGVKGVLTVSYDRVSSLKAAAKYQCYQCETIFRACGIHPEHADERIPEELLSDERAFRRTFSAIGEIGLDYREGMPPRDIQQACFEDQLKLCMDLKLPAVIHSVKACDDTLRILKAYRGLRFVMHGFSYSPEAAREFVRLGAYIGVGARLLDEKARRLPATVREISVDRLLPETDLPFSGKYMSAQNASPKRGSMTACTDDKARSAILCTDSSAHATLLSCITDAISSIKNIPAGRVAGITTENAMSLF